MSTKKEASNLLDQHLRLLDGVPCDQGDYQEQERVAELNLDELVLQPSTRRFQTWTLGSVLAVAAALMLVILNQSGNPFGVDRDLTPKGSLSVRLFVEQEDVVFPVDERTTLGAGDRVNAEVSVSQPAVAYMVVYSGSGDMLSQIETTWLNRLELVPGESSSFRFAFELDDQNDGEVLTVFVCGNVPTNSLTDLEAQLKLRFGRLPAQDLLNMDGTVCNVRTFSLRH